MTLLLQAICTIVILFSTYNSFANCKICNYSSYQRWSRGHKARGQGQGQGHKKNPRPRPRTAFPRTEPLEAKDRNARGQGQGPRTQPQVFSKKKGLQKSFPDNLQFKGVARIFDWGGLNHKSHAMTSSKICLLFT